MEKRYALAEEVKKVEQRLDYKITSDQLDAIQERLWKITDRYKGKVMEDTVKEEYRKLEMTKEKLQKKLDVLEEKDKETEKK